MPLRIRDSVFEPSRGPLVMGVLNVTPDSFSDGGLYFDADRAVRRAEEMIAEGADLIDVGAESTRPGAEEVRVEEQIRRAVPVIERIRGLNARIGISIDTRSAAVAGAALAAGADLINDTSALRDDPQMAPLAAKRGVPVVLMHRRGTPKTMQTGGGPQYDDVIAEICAFFDERVRGAEKQGIERSRIILDPGIGFGKRVEHNLLILRHLERFVATGLPVMVGASRKRFIGALLDLDDPQRREAGSLACAAMAALAGVAIVRAHDVRATVEVVRLCGAALGS